ncbi:hypothetical protein JCM10449v2_003695 [Rhodotorula kratochvilovae]
MDESFVVVSPHPHPPPALVAFFPSLNPSSAAPPLAPAALAQVHAARARQPDAQLFIDHLLHLALPDDQLQFPPATHSDLEHLVARLSTASGALVARSCLYYLALALSGSQLAAALARDLLLPLAFRLATRAFYALDTADYRTAVRLLADPRVEPDFVPRTLAVLASVPEPASDRAELVLSYWRLARIDLARHGKDEAKHVLRALCAPERAHGVAEAWDLARNWHVEAERDELARSVLATCFGDNHTRRPLATHLSALMLLPFTPAEDALSTSFCALPPAPLALALTVDWRLSKLIAEARPVDALRFASQAKRDHGDRLAQSDARDRLLKAVEANLTDVQRATLALAPAAPAPAPVQQPTSSSSSQARITHPAWAPPPPAPAPAPLAPSTPAPGPPRTLAAARAAQAPAPAPPQPGPADLPLSASPFVRSAAGGAPQGQGQGQGGVLRALEASQQTPRRPVAASGTPGSPFARPAPTPAQQQQEQAQQAKPTLAGFGSVRQAALTASVLGGSPRKPAPGPAPRRDDEDEEDAEMRSPATAAAAQEDEDEDEKEEEEEEPFASRAARDPAVLRTLAAASSARTPRRAAGAKTLRGGEASKRRAVARAPPHEGEVDAKKSKRRTTVARPPPGAFPASASASEGEGEGEHEEEEEHEERAPQQEDKKPAQTPATARRRSARASSSRAGTAEPPSPGPSAARRATRASSAAPEAAPPAKTPVRRSSRLSGLGGTGGGAEGTARKTRAAKGRGKGRIDEESGEE